MKRAAAAKAGIYGNDAAEAMYPFTRVDSDGQTLDGSKHNYTLTFPAGQLPPVNAFWSLTMYDGKTQLLIENPINRYLINSPMLPDHEDERGRVADALHPEQIAGRRQGSELAAGARRPDLFGDAALLAEDNAAVDPAGRRRDMAAAQREEGLINSPRTARLIPRRVHCWPIAAFRCNAMTCRLSGQIARTSATSSAWQ